MSEIPYKATGFPASSAAHLKGSHVLKADLTDLVWAAITVGKYDSLHLISHGALSIFDALARAFVVYATLRRSGNSYVKSSLYDAQDQSEKVGTSYAIGMLVTKLAASELLQTPWVFHLKHAHAYGHSYLLHGNSMPDLVGMNASGQWVVLEAKGRTNGFDAKALAKAKAQCKQLRHISGQLPIYRVASQAYFSPNLSLRLDDPDFEDQEPIDVELKVDAVVRQYYAPILRLVAESKETLDVGGREVAVRHFPDAGISIGMDSSVRGALENGQFENLPQAMLELPEKSLLRNEGGKLFRDGLYIQLGGRWDEEKMNIDPTERGVANNSLQARRP